MKRKWFARIAVLAALTSSSIAFAVPPGQAATGGVDPNAILRIGLNFQVSTYNLDPALRTSNKVMIPISEAIFDNLVRKDPVTGKLSPGLAVSWDIPDPLTLELKLRQGVTFHDGTPFNAEAVRFSFDRQIAAVKARKVVGLDPQLMQLTSTEVVNANTVRLHLGAPVTGLFLNEMFPTADTIPIVSPAAVAKYGDAFNDHPVGAGPFQFESHTPNQQVSVRKYAKYWDKKSYRFGGIDFIQTRPGNEAVTALRSGRIDSGVLDAATAVALQGQAGFKVKSQVPTESTWQISLPLCVAPFDNPKVRDAISIGLDRKEIMQAIGGGTPTEVYFTPESKFYSKTAAKMNRYDLKAAKALLEGQGPFPALTLLLKTSPDDQTIGTVIQSQLQALGFKVNIQIQSPSISADLVRLKPMFVTGTPLRSASAYFVAGGQANLHCNYDNPTATQAWNSALRDLSLSEAERVKAFDRAEQILADQGPSVWLGASPFHNGYVTALKGVQRLNAGDQESLILRTLYKSKKS